MDTLAQITTAGHGKNGNLIQLWHTRDCGKRSTAKDRGTKIRGFGSLNSEKYNNANRKPVPERRRYPDFDRAQKQNAADRMAAQEWRATLRKHGWPRRCAKNSNHRNTATGSKTNRMETGDS